MKTFPWDYDNRLTKDRLVTLANFITEVRGDVIELFDEDLGDTPCSLGMRAYECCRSRIIFLADSGKYPWLKNLTRTGRFTFLIDEIPVRFTRGDPAKLPDEKLIRSYEAKRQLLLFEEDRANVRWFFVFDTRYRSAADAVFFVGYNECGEIECRWQIPIEDTVSLLSSVSEPLPQAKEILPAPVRLKLRVVKAENEE